MLNDDYIETSLSDEEEEDEALWAECNLEGYENFHRANKDCKVWWTNPIDTIGVMEFSFDLKKSIIFLEITHTI